MVLKNSSQTGRFLIPKNVFFCIFFGVFWLLPITYTGFTNKDVPLLPRTFGYFYRISFLFTHPVNGWPVYYIQIRTGDSLEWITLPENDYFRLEPFAHRTRLNPIFIHSHYAIGYKEWAKGRKARLQELAEWIARKYADTHAEQPPPSVVRFVKTYVIYKKGAKFPGHWQKPPLDSFKPNEILVVSTHYFDDE